MGGGEPRLHALDGLRGWAALSVVCFHMSWETFGSIFPIFRNPVTGSLLDGHLAVWIFFVLSGEALSVGFLSGKGSRFAVDLALRRYPRLVIPILAVGLIVFSLEQLKLLFNLPAGVIVGRVDWLGGFLSHAHSLYDVARFALFDVFTAKTFNFPKESVDPFLWTMRPELIGSAIVFATIILLNGRSVAWYVVAILLILSLVKGGGYAQLGCFLAGMILAQLRLSGVFSKMNRSSRMNILFLAIFVLLMAADAVLNSANYWEGRYPLFAIAIIGSIFACRATNGFLQGRLSQFMGRISFPLFLVQFPILVSVVSYAIKWASERSLLNLGGALMIALFGVAVSILGAVAFSPVEGFAKRASRWVSHLLLKGVAMGRRYARPQAGG